jgi:hypothetical protein
MCLSVVTKTFDPPDVAERWAWKVFCNKLSSPATCCGLYFGYDGKDFLRELDGIQSRAMAWPKGEWLQAVQREIKYDLHKVYMTGFHCYRTRSSARIVQRQDRHRRKVVKVKIRGVRFNGVQDGFQVLVADELFIPE